MIMTQIKRKQTSVFFLMRFVTVYLSKGGANMTQIANVMQVYPDKVDEYKKRHDELWPEMRNALKEHSVKRYSIFLHPATYQLFATLEVENIELWSQMANTEICQKWWRYMEDVMETNEDYSPVSIDLNLVFCLE